MSELEAIAGKIREADGLLIAASNGLSISEGLHLFASNEAFHTLFGDYARKYGLLNILQGIAGRWPSEEEKWAFWSRLIRHYCVEYRPGAVMQDLKAIADGRDTFVLTSNGEGHFEAAGFAPECIYEVEGNWIEMHCSARCSAEMLPTTQLAVKLAALERDGRIPSGAVPRCAHCGAPMVVSMAAGEPYMTARTGAPRFEAFLSRMHGRKLVILELGIGPRNQLIKAPLMRLAAREPLATYVTVNRGEIYVAEDIREKSFALDGLIAEKLAGLREALGV